MKTSSIGRKKAVKLETTFTFNFQYTFSQVDTKVTYITKMSTIIPQQKKNHVAL